MLGRNYLRRRDLEHSIEVFQEITQREPTYADPFLGMAEAWALLPFYVQTIDRDKAYGDALAALAQLERLDGGPDRAYAIRAIILAQRGDFIDAREQFDRALAIRPNDGNLRQWYSQFLSMVGYLDASYREAQLALDLEASPVVVHRLAIAALWADDIEAAERYFALAASMGIGADINPEPYLVLLYRLQRYDEMKTWLFAVLRAQDRQNDWVEPAMMALESHNDEQVAAAVATLSIAWQRQEVSARLYWGFLILFEQWDVAIAATRQLLDYQPFADELQFMFARETAGIRARPGFDDLVERTGLRAFWAENGLPPACEYTEDRISCR